MEIPLKIINKLKPAPTYRTLHPHTTIYIPNKKVLAPYMLRIRDRR